MSGPSPQTKKPIYLSASRIETFQTCSALYAAKYLLKLPDPVGKAARIGSVAHDTLEILANPRHENVFSAAIHHDTCMEVPALWRVVQRFARKYDVFDPENLPVIDSHIMTGLRNEFKGPKGTIRVIPEQEFNVQVDRGDGRKWNARGFLDQLFFVEDETGKWLDIKDFKTGKMFKDEKLRYNVQALMYLLISRELYPEFQRRRFRFLFTKNKRGDWQTFLATNDQLDGFEWILSALQRAMDSFTEKNAADDMRATRGDSCWIYGQECKAKHPKSYFVLVDEAGQLLSGADAETDLKPKDNQRVEKRHYPGCPHYYGGATNAQNHSQ